MQDKLNKDRNTSSYTKRNTDKLAKLLRENLLKRKKQQRAKDSKIKEK